MQKTVIHVRDIGPDGLKLSYSLDKGWLKEALGGLEIDVGPDGVSAEISLDKLGGDVLASGLLQGSVTLPCARCLTASHVDVGARLRMSYGRDDEDAEDEGWLDDVDFTAFNGETVDLGVLLREQILLSLPMSPRCREDCRGLCLQCGTELNSGLCDCAPLLDPRFEVLRDIKLT